MSDRSAPRPPSNRALAVLGLLLETGELTCVQVSDAIRERTPCGQCGGTGEGDDSRWGCRRCYGRGRVLFTYSHAYQALKQLYRLGLVRRRHALNEWGDETPGWLWRTAEVAPVVDELEALYLAPAAEKERG